MSTHQHANKNLDVVRVGRPWHIPMREWLAIGQQVRNALRHDHIFLISAGIAFLAILALLPTLSALLSLYGLVTSPAELHQQLQALQFLAPPGIIELLNENLTILTRQSGSALGVTIAISTALSIWVATRAVMGIIGALNIVYAEREQRSSGQLVATATALAIGSLLFWVGTLLIIVGAPLILSQLQLGSNLLSIGAQVLRWVLIAGAVLISMTLLYFFGPNHKHPRWRWLSVGSVVATLLWLAGSSVLSFYTSNISDFSNIYGQLGVIVVLQLWFFLTAFSFLIGAEINVEMESRMDTPEILPVAP